MAQAEPTQQGISSVAVQCDPQVFSTAQRKTHAEQTIDILTRMPHRRDRLDNGYLFHYHGGSEVFLKVAQWAADDHRCCGWVSYAVELQAAASGQPSTVLLRATTSDEGKDALIAATEATLSNPEQATQVFLGAQAPIRAAAFAQQLRKGGCGC